VNYASRSAGRAASCGHQRERRALRRRASALNYLNQYYAPSGALQIPMLMVSTWRDPVVPGFHQISHRNFVAASGHSDLLVQRTVNRYGHCVFTPAELGTAFTDLVRWVEFGIKPAP